MSVTEFRLIVPLSNVTLRSPAACSARTNLWNYSRSESFYRHVCQYGSVIRAPQPDVNTVARPLTFSGREAAKCNLADLHLLGCCCGWPCFPPLGL